MELAKNVFSAITIVLAGYILFTDRLGLMPYMMLFLGCSILMTGLVELRKHRQGLQKNNHRFWGYMNIAVSIFIFSAALEGFLADWM